MSDALTDASWIFWWGLILSAVRLTTPLVFASLGGLLTERSGVINVALEGFVLLGAFSAAAASLLADSTMVGWSVAFLVPAIAGAAFALFTVNFRADQIITGMAFNIFIAGLIPLLNKFLFQSTGSTPSLELALRPGLWPYFLALALVIGVHFFLKKTQGGLWLRAAGEEPATLSASGLSVKKVRWWALFLGAGLAGWGGATLSIVLGSAYSPMMSGGRGFIALAALIFGRWRPLPTLAACFLFGFTDALQIRWQGASVGGVIVPVQFIQCLPYLITILALAGFMGHSRPPKSLGRPTP